MKRALLVLLLVSTANVASAQTNPIDVVRPDAPELAAFGAHDIGVRTLVVTDSGRPDVLNARAGEPVPVYDRSLTVEVWYPAALAQGRVPGTQYTTITRNPGITATLTGRAVRGAAANDGGPYPLVIVSHGYPGNRYLMSHLGENLASKGYVVASIDHKGSTYDDQQDFGSTLYNRPPDQRAVLNAMAGFAADASHFLYGVVDANSTAIIGYSMGGYGALNNLGAGYSESSVTSDRSPPNRLLNDHAAGNPDYRRSLDPRIKAGIPIGAWGMRGGFWDAAGLAGMTVPALFVAGDADGVAGYEGGIRAIYEGAINSDRYMLVFKNAGHNAGAPIPLPVEFLDAANTQGASHYTDSVWDNVRMNNILQHFATAFLDLHLKGVSDMRSYLDLPQDGAGAGQEGWKGFAGGGAIGLMMYHD